MFGIVAFIVLIGFLCWLLASFRVLGNVVGEHVQIFNDIFAASGSRCLYSVGWVGLFGSAEAEN